MALSKKYYKELAEIIGASKNKSLMIERMISLMKRDNPRFDEERFRRAIGSYAQMHHGNTIQIRNKRFKI